MVDALPITSDDVERVLKALDNTKYGVLVLSAVVVLLIIAAFLLVRWWVMRKEEREQVAKDERSRRLAESLNKLAESHATLAASHAASTERLSETLHNLTKATDRMDASVTVLQQRASGQMSRTVSLRFIRSQLARSAYQDICLLFERSLTENRYAERKQFIADKMRTAIGTVLADVRAELRAYPLAMSPDVFFPTYADPQGGGERFYLCDAIWLAVEPLYLKKTPLNERLEEAFLAVKNTTNDHYTAIHADVTTKQAADDGSSGPFKSESALVRRMVALEPVDKIMGPKRFLTPRPGG